MVDPAIPSPVFNYFLLFQHINNHIIRVMGSFGTGSAFGSLKKHHFGMTRNLSHWNYYHWEGTQHGDPNSILNCDTLKVEIQKERSVPLKNAMENEIKHMGGK